MKRIVLGVCLVTLMVCSVASGAWRNKPNFKNVTIEDDLTVGDDLTVSDDVTVAGDVSITGTMSAGLGSFTQYVMATTTRATNYTFVAADYGKVHAVTNISTVNYTLPTNAAAAGSWFEVMSGNGAADTTIPTFLSDPTDTLVGPNDVDLKSVTYGTGHRIGFYIRFVADGTKWHAINVGSTTMSNND